MSTRLDLAGRVFGRLTVLSFAGSIKGQARWNARCECGQEKVVRSGNILRGKTVSCGCRRREAMREGRERLHQGSRTHGKSRTDLYEIWKGILRRCLNAKAAAYPLYGGRGIKVDASWAESFERFEADVLATIGPRPSKSHSIDRRDNNGHYVINNLRWATAKEQVHNSRTFQNGLTHWTKAALIREVEELRSRCAAFEKQLEQAGLR